MPQILTPRTNRTRPRAPMPAWVKLALMLLVIFGVVFSGWLRKKERSDVRLVADEVTDYSEAWVDVYFLVMNTSSLDYADLPVMIRVYADETMQFEIASRLTTIDVKAGESTRMMRRLEQLKRPPAESEKPFATVEIHQHGGLF